LLSSTQPDCEELDEAVPFCAHASTPFIMPDIHGGSFTLEGEREGATVLGGVEGRATEAGKLATADARLSSMMRRR